VALLVTQNIDGLHLAAGSSPERTIEIHGSIRDSACLSCGDRRPMRETLDRVRAGDPDPACQVCGGILKSATVSFGQNLDPDDLARAEAAADDADVFLAVGTSLTVYPVARRPERAVAGGARLVIVNAEATPLDAYASAVIRGRAGEVLPAIVSALRSAA
jgi:NAD-dependent deacetylase